MAKTVLLKDLLKIEGFNPLNLDISYIQEELDGLPKNGEIDINIAEALATRWLRAADYCSELLAKASRWMGYKKTLKNAELAAAGLRTGQSSATAQKQLAPMDGAYIESANNFTEAEACCMLLKEKHDSLMAAHYLAKEILKRHVVNEKANSWQGGDEDYSRKEQPAPGKVDDPDFEDVGSDDEPF